jgi:CheY-like chemotaxis protein
MPDTLPTLSGVSLLVVENDTDNLDMFAMFLRHCGAHVITAQTATAALRCLTPQRIDAIVTDVSALKDMGAANFLRDVRDMPHHNDTPVIAVTGWSEKDPKVTAACFTAFLLKPVNLDEVAATIIRLVKRTAEPTGLL